MAARRSLMVLGAGPYQVPVIKKAVEHGYYVVSVDYLPDNLGHRFSHESIDCSTVDVEGVLAHARRLRIDGIATMASDVATSTVAQVARELGLNGASPYAAETMSNKHAFRAFQHENGLRSPAFVVTDEFDELVERIRGLTLPIMLKPIDTSGSRGVARIEGRHLDVLRRVFEQAKLYSRAGVICAEEYIVGLDVSGDGFVADGTLFGLVTNKRKRGYVPTGHSLPSLLDSDSERIVLDEVERHCAALGYSRGPVDFDVRIADGVATVVEMSPRLGGNGIPMIVERSSGMDIIGLTVEHSLGHTLPELAPPVVRSGSGSLVIGSHTAGIIENVSNKQTVQSEVPEVFDLVLGFGVGDRVPAMNHGGDQLGYALFDCDSVDHYTNVVGRIQTALRLTVRPETDTSNQNRVAS